MALDPIDCEGKMETEDEEEVYASKVKTRLMEVFQEMTNKITPEVFNEIFQQFQDNGENVMNVDVIVQKFKENLYASICENFKDMWHCQEIEFSLMVLNFCKKKCKNNTTAWRPTGKTPEEQTKYLRVHFLKKKIAYVNDAMKAQEKVLHEAMQAVADKRLMIGNLSSRRDSTSQQMDIRIAQINKSL